MHQRKSQRQGKQIIHERYRKSLREYLTRKKVQFSEQTLSNIQNSEEVIFTINQSEQMKNSQNQFYYTLMRRFYDQRKVLNPQMSFQAFLTQYNSQLNRNLSKLNLNGLIQTKQASNSLNSLIALTELNILKKQTVQNNTNKKDKIRLLLKQEQKVNKQYEDVVKRLVEKNTMLNIENLQLQVKIKQNEIGLQQLKTQVNRNTAKQKHKQTLNSSGKIAKKQDSNKVYDPKKQQVQRIKLIISNNMWGWGQKITEKLQKLKSLKQELSQS